MQALLLIFEAFISVLTPFSSIRFRVGIFNRVDEVYSRASSPITFTGNILHLNKLKTCSLPLKLKFLFTNSFFKIFFHIFHFHIF